MITEIHSKADEDKEAQKDILDLLGKFPLPKGYFLDLSIRYPRLIKKKWFFDFEIAWFFRLEDTIHVKFGKESDLTDDLKEIINNHPAKFEIHLREWKKFQ